jgi:general secretion pathway protein G
MILHEHRRELAARGGFTLMELLVVVAIIVVLAGVGGYYYMGSLDDAKIQAAKAQMRILTDACKSYKLGHDDWPASLAVLLQPNESTGNPYLDDPNAINDPWGRPYQYNAAGSHNNGLKPDIWCDAPKKGQVGNWSGAK